LVAWTTLMDEAVFFQVYSDLPRQGPGSEASTRRALSLLGELPEEPGILDLGCGPGAQTLALARSLPKARITAVDLHQRYLDELSARAAASGLSNRIGTRCASMDALDFPAGSFDLIWCEGAIYLVGVERALKLWRPLLRPGGRLAFTEISWLVNDPPAEVAEYWQKLYPAIATADANCARCDGAGYRVVDQFALPPEDWYTDYYTPLANRCAQLRQDASPESGLLQVIEETEEEIRMFERFHTYYGYVFYLLKV
jgi:SAM-dependent methyltransferase